MPDLSVYHGHIVFVHLLSVFGFLLAHGISAGVLFRVRGERDPVALASLLSLSERAVLAMAVALLAVLATGILAGFSGGYWTGGRLWLWASVAVFLVVGGLMTPLARLPMDRLRIAIGARPPKDAGTATEPAVADAAAIEIAAAAVRPGLVTAIGVLGVVVLAWLMMYQPF